MNERKMYVSKYVLGKWTEAYLEKISKRLAIKIP